MKENRDLYLQRIPDGLRLLTRSVSGRTLVLTREGMTRPFGEIDLEHSSERDGEGPFDATLEAFHQNRRVSEEEIAALGIGRLVEEPDIELRLVVNHTLQADPFADPEWISNDLSIAHRPTLSRISGEDQWGLAFSLPCREVRIFERTVDHGWRLEVVRQGQAGGPTWKEERSGTGNSELPDLYQRLVKRFPTRASARPFVIAARGDRPIKKKPMDAFSMKPIEIKDEGGKPDGPHS